MRNVSLTLPIALLLLASPASARSIAAHADFRGSPIVVAADLDRWAGAVSSITWRGRQFVNTDDHGRELQSAITFDRAAECENPTEAGSRDDGRRSRSTSRLLAAAPRSVSSFSTETQMAYWLAPGETSPSCPAGSLNRARLSDVVIDKTVTVGAFGIPNVIRLDVSFSVPEPYDSIQFEEMTLYSPTAFSSVWSYDPATRALTKENGRRVRGLAPVILATPDGRFASGVFSPESPIYHARRLEHLGAHSTEKWSAVGFAGDTAPGHFGFTVFVAVGALPDVVDALDRLAAIYSSVAARALSRGR
jgi:hypothetical protein